jgi:Cyclic nucleotide-binding domain
VTETKFRYEVGRIICQADDVLDKAILIEDGAVRISKYRDKIEVPIALLGPGDIIGSESIYSSKAVSYNAVVVEEMKGHHISRDDLVSRKSEFPDWINICINFYFRNQLVSKRPERSNVATLYSISNLLLVFLKSMEKNKISNSLSGNAGQLIEELDEHNRKASNYINPVIRGLSSVGLIDFDEKNPIESKINIPDLDLYKSFLHFLQFSSDVRGSGDLERFKRFSIKIADKTSSLLDGLLVEERFADRFFQPEYSVVHLTLDDLDRIYSSTGMSDKLDQNHESVDELDKLGAFTKVRDSGKLTLFVELRNLLRINIRRDLTNNFIDIIDFLLEEMYDARFKSIRHSINYNVEPFNQWVDDLDNI